MKLRLNDHSWTSDDETSVVGNLSFIEAMHMAGPPPAYWRCTKKLQIQSILGHHQSAKLYWTIHEPICRSATVSDGSTRGENC